MPVLLAAAWAAWAQAPTAPVVNPVSPPARGGQGGTRAPALQNVGVKSSTVAAMGYGAGGKPVGIMLVRIP